MSGLFEPDENVRHIRKPQAPKSDENKKSKPKSKKVKDVGPSINARLDLIKSKKGFDFGQVDINPAAKVPKPVKAEPSKIIPKINYVE